MWFKGILLTLLLVLAAYSLPAQAQDSAKNSTNELLLEGEGIKSKDPTRAALLSAVLPGLGQVYNKKYWKLPIVYGGAYALGFGINWNHDNYNDVRNAVFAIESGNVDPDNPLHNAPISVLERERDNFRRDRDFLIIGSILAYFIVIADSFVDAHLKSWPVGKEQSLKISPSLEPVMGSVSSGIALIINL